MDIRPQALPELRAELSGQMARPRVINSLWGDESEGRPDVNAWLASTTRTLEMFYVAPSMADLAVQAADSLEEFELRWDDLPAPHGLLIFDGAALLVSREGESLRGFVWYSRGDFLAMPVISVPSRQDIPNLIIDPSSAFCALPHGKVDGIWARDDRQWNACGLLVSTWLLMGQPLLASQSQVEPDRAAKKRLQRAGHESAAVRVIELRQPKHASNEPGESGREYQHRWITRGHWRQQWYPSREVHRPVWIAPHVKGPEGAPLIGGEKVYAWKR